MPNSHQWLLLESQAKLEHDRFIALINTLDDGFLATSSQGVIELSNSAALSLLDTNVVRGKLLQSVLKLEDPNGNPVDVSKLTADLSKKVLIASCLLISADSTKVHVQVSITPVRTFKGRHEGGFLVLIRQAGS